MKTMKARGSRQTTHCWWVVDITNSSFNEEPNYNALCSEMEIYTKKAK